jgi:iron complex outermembrane receptor protein
VSLKSFDFTSKQVQRLYGNNGATGVTATGTIPFNFAQFATDFPGSRPAQRDHHGLSASS